MNALKRRELCSEAWRCLAPQRDSASGGACARPTAIRDLVGAGQHNAVLLRVGHEQVKTHCGRSLA
jgi:hypothetical protein